LHSWVEEAFAEFSIQLHGEEDSSEDELSADDFDEHEESKRDLILLQASILQLLSDKATLNLPPRGLLELKKMLLNVKGSPFFQQLTEIEHYHFDSTQTIGEYCKHLGLNCPSDIFNLYSHDVWATFDMVTHYVDLQHQFIFPQASRSPAMLFLHSYAMSRNNQGQSSVGMKDPLLDSILLLLGSYVDAPSHTILASSSPFQAMLQILTRHYTVDQGTGATSFSVDAIPDCDGVFAGIRKSSFRNTEYGQLPDDVYAPNEQWHTNRMRVVASFCCAYQGYHTLKWFLHAFNPMWELFMQDTSQITEFQDDDHAMLTLYSHMKSPVLAYHAMEYITKCIYQRFQSLYKEPFSENWE
jgi:hypothetical protein